MSFKPGGGLDKLRADLARGKARGARELKEQLGRLVSGGGASGPGDYPSKDTGELAGSFFVTEEGGKTVVGNDAPHAVYLEFKPPSEGGRPFMSSGAADAGVQEAVARAVAEGVKNG